MKRQPPRVKTPAEVVGKSKKTPPVKSAATPTRPKIIYREDSREGLPSSSEEDDERDEDFIPDDMHTEVAEEETQEMPVLPTTGRKRKRMPTSAQKSSTRSIRTVAHTPPIRAGTTLRRPRD